MFEKYDERLDKTMSKMMKAAVVYAENDIRYEDYPIPEMKPGHVKIRVKACGICGSDVPRVLGKAAHFYPIILGHEFSGEIVEIAEDVDTLEKGDRVVCASLIPCYGCPDCALGHFSLCKNYTFIGSRVQGGFADYVVVPAANAIKFSSKYSYEEAALTEPASVALHGVLLNDFRGGGSVGIVGAGTIGILTAIWTKIFGASEVVFFDVEDDRLTLAKEITGFEGVNTLRESPEKAAKRFTNGRGFNYVFGASGAAESFKTCFFIAANKSHICFIGTPTNNITFSVKEWEIINRRELKITGSWMSYTSPFPGKAWTICTEFLSSGKLRFDRRLIYKIFPMSKCKEAFNCYLSSSEVKGRIILINEDSEKE